MKLPYGRGFLELELPAQVDVIEPSHVRGLEDELDALTKALRRPQFGPALSERVRHSDSIGIVVCDVTRPFPAARVLPVLIDELKGHAITIFVATGTHRPCASAELELMLGRDVLDRTTVVQHDCFDQARHASLGTVPGTGVPALIEKGFLDQDVRITTGFIEPHFFAGFSGGPKMVAPGLAALETVLELHSATRIAHPKARWGVVDGNPIHDAIREIAARASVTFNLDVTLNREREITGVFAGDLFDSHQLGCDFARKTAMVRSDRLYDVVVTTNSGYPLDQNLYQTVKGMSAAAQIVKPGGAIVVVSECSDGLPDHGGYRHLLAKSDTPEGFLRMIEQQGFVTHDQWQVQIQAMIRLRARVFVKNEVVTDAVLRESWLDPVDDVGATVARLMKEAGPEGRLAVLPDGPQTVPFVAEPTPMLGGLSLEGALRDLGEDERPRLTGRASPAKAAVGDKPVFAYIASLPQPQRGIAETVDALAAKALPDLRRSVKWGMSYYGVGDGWCFSCGGFAGHVKLMFVNGAALEPVPPVTPVGMGKSTRGVELESIDDIDERQVAAWMKQVASVPGLGGKKR